MRQCLFYVLAEDGKTPIAEPDMQKYGEFFHDIGKRTVAKTTVGNCEVSTVFMCLDHNYTGSGDPVLWETLVFGGAMDGYQLRYQSYDEALSSHNHLCDYLQHLNESLPTAEVVKQVVVKPYKKLPRAIVIRGDRNGAA